MDGLRKWITAILVVLVFGFDVLADQDRVYMVSTPEPVAMPLGDETTLICELNLKPDNFTWRHYPLLNPRLPINLASSPYRELPRQQHKEERKRSELRISLDNESQAGDYQCLAQVGATILASVPARITIATLERISRQEDSSLVVAAGNTVIWWWEIPFSDPPASIDYFKNGLYFSSKHNLQRTTRSLILPNVTVQDSGVYKCRIENTVLQQEETTSVLNLKVVQNMPHERPHLIRPLKEMYTAVKGQTVFLECPVVGNPVPNVSWSKKNGQLPIARSEMVYGGLKIKNVSSSDDGVYDCVFTNPKGTFVKHITLVYNEPPVIEKGLEDKKVTVDEFLDFECIVRGTPEPVVSWVLNGNSVLNDTSIEAIENRLYFRPVEKRHAGLLQCFATSSIKTVYSSTILEVVPKQISSADAEESGMLQTPSPHQNKRKKHKQLKHKGAKNAVQMVPPSKPTISRVSDNSVMVRWSVPSNNGLPIQFFKVQYRELGPENQNESHVRSKGSRWKTTNEDISSHRDTFEVRDLKSNYYYKFRIAAVYSNNDNKISQHSSRFLLKSQDFFLRNPLPVPRLTHTEAINSSSVKIYWECELSPNVTLNGFYVNFMNANNAGDFVKDTVEGQDARSHIITHLQPDTMYDIKLQSFTTNSASEFSAILKQKTTKGEMAETAPTAKVLDKEAVEAETVQASPHLYIFIATGVIALAGTLLVVLLVCRKWKQKKTGDSKRGDRDKPTVESSGHHIQADSNDYIVSPKTLPRNNGCVGTNRMNITANPLADADNKTQNMIEMSCLSNNNCSTAAAQASASSPHETGDKKNRKDSSPRENYV